MVSQLPLDLNIDTALDILDEPVVEAVNGDPEGMDVDADVDELNDAEKNAGLDAEEDKAEEEVSQQDEEAQPIEDPEGDDEPADPEVEGEGDEDQDQDLDTNKVENENDDNENENDKEENEEEPLPDGDLEDQEIELQPVHQAEALDILASMELKFAMRKGVCRENGHPGLGGINGESL